MKPADAPPSDSDFDVDDCSCIDYQRKDDVPGVEIVTSENETFWFLIAHGPVFDLNTLIRR